jgi:hypothetical protein
VEQIETLAPGRGASHCPLADHHADLAVDREGAGADPHDRDGWGADYVWPSPMGFYVRPERAGSDQGPAPEVREGFEPHGHRKFPESRLRCGDPAVACLVLFETRASKERRFRAMQICLP